MEVPDEINLENAILNSDRYSGHHDNSMSLSSAEHNRMFFYPTEEELVDQCFNLDEFLSALILKRLVFYRTYPHRNTIVKKNTQYNPSDEEECRMRIEESDKYLDWLIKGWWIGLNVDEKTDEQEKHWRDARISFAENFEYFWF